MSDNVLVAETGRPTGSASSRRLRSEDRIPAVVYGQGMSPIAISVERRALRQALSGAAGMNTVLDLSVDGQVFPAIVKDVQRHPVRRTVSHVDFFQVNLNVEITVSVPLRLEGEAREVVANGGLVDPSVDTIEVLTRPRNIPDEFVVDISDLTMDSVVRLGDLPVPAGVTLTGDPDMPIVTVLVMRASELETEAGEGEAEAGEGEAGGEAEAAGDAGEGDAPTADE